jgi:hypothetical protein
LYRNALAMLPVKNEHEACHPPGVNSLATFLWKFRRAAGFRGLTVIENVNLTLFALRK